MVSLPLLLLSSLPCTALADPVTPARVELVESHLVASGEVAGCPSDAFHLAFEPVGLDEARLWIERTVTSRTPCDRRIPWSVDVELPAELRPLPRLVLSPSEGGGQTLRGPAPPTPSAATPAALPAPAVPADSTTPPRRRKGR